MNDTEAQRQYVIELVGKLQYLIDFLAANGYLEEGCFTFPDGDIWHATEK